MTWLERTRFDEKLIHKRAHFRVGFSKTRLDDRRNREGQRVLSLKHIGVLPALARTPQPVLP